MHCRLNWPEKGVPMYLYVCQSSPPQFTGSERSLLETSEVSASEKSLTESSGDRGLLGLSGEYLGVQHNLPGCS